MVWPRLSVVCMLFLPALAETADPAWSILDRAYAALRTADYEAAAAGFREALKLAPERVAVHKDLGYTLLKIGETEAACDTFAEAMRLDPADDHLALEYAFLAYETNQQAAARRIFDRVRRKGNVKAETTFSNIESELGNGIARWTRAVELSPDNFSGHAELARLAEQRDDLALAAKHYRRAWDLRPDRRSFLLDLGRVLQGQGLHEQANAALLAASRGAESRVAEKARELLSSRYPYVYEFRSALDLDPRNLPLRRELAWLYLEMGQKDEAEREFREVVKADTKDEWALAQLGFLLLARNKVDEAFPLFERVLTSEDGELQDRVRLALQLPRTLRKRTDVPRSQTSAQALELAQRSLDAGYLKDALKYLRIAHENDPLDFSVMLKLGWTHNNLRDDRQAVDWFGLARRSPNKTVSAEAGQAFKNLNHQFARIRTSAWLYPFYSSRWRDVFSYAQVRSEVMPSWFVHPYLSVRFAGDIRRTAEPATQAAAPTYLSDSAFILGGGVTTNTWHGLRGWFEAGKAMRYLRQTTEAKQTTLDLRGGLAWSRSFGRNFGTKKRGIFGETANDLVYVSRFDQDTLVYNFNRVGYTVQPSGPAQLQLSWNLNITADTRRYGWANSIETGPGVRLRLPSLPTPLLLTIDALSGRTTVLDGTRPPRYSDLRIGFWYAFSH